MKFLGYTVDMMLIHISDYYREYRFTKNNVGVHTFHGEKGEGGEYTQVTFKSSSPIQIITKAFKPWYDENHNKPENLEKKKAIADILNGE